MKNIKLAAFDMDGTVVNTNGEITDCTAKSLRDMTERGIEVVIATGRDYGMIPQERFRDTNVNYFVTVNGSGVYDMRTEECLYEEFIDFSLASEMIRRFRDKRMVVVVYTNGCGVYERAAEPYFSGLQMPDYLRNAIYNDNHPVEDLFAYLEEHGNRVQKITYFLQRDVDGSCIDEDELKPFLEEQTEITFVDGGYHNYECTKAGVSKGKTLTWLCDKLGVPMEQVVAVGDSDNDLSMMNAAGFSIAMGNAPESIRVQADAVTGTNDEDGVAQAVEAYIL